MTSGSSLVAIDPYSHPALFRSHLLALFNIDASNISAGALGNVEIRATLPAGVTVDSVSAGGTDLGNGEVVWSTTSLAVGAALHHEITVTVDGLAAGDIADLDVSLTHDGGEEIDNSALEKKLLLNPLMVEALMVLLPTILLYLLQVMDMVSISNSQIQILYPEELICI